MKQTVVEWLEIALITDPISEQDFEHNINSWKQAKAMEKEQIIETSKNSYIAGYLDNQAKVNDSMNFPKDYYNETYGGEQ